MRTDFDIIVIGAGHAGCEASVAAAKLGCRVLLITMDFNKIAQMSCNPSMGGIAKGQIIREIDALGGMSGIVADASTLQFRMLNRSKGPAMWSPRAQCDRLAFSANWRWIVENTPGLSLWQDTVTAFDFSSSGITSLSTSLGCKFTASYYILTAGTFLNGRIFVGDRMTEGGRVGEPSSRFISDQLSKSGITMSRMKTGTPPRVDIRTVDTTSLLLQCGDSEPEKFSYLPYLTAPQARPSLQKPCYIAHTNPHVHSILYSGFDRSPLFTGRISGIGPRYCPSIEDKLRTFPDRESHQIFLEPETADSIEYYVQGFSSSLPFDVQAEALARVEGFGRVHILRPAYAIEYDYFDPTLLDHTLRSRVIPNLYMAGQVNGTTGYEEAAAQGLLAGINAALVFQGNVPIELTRDSSYMGVLVDDLVTKGVDEPYRMFTSRAEYRILLRQDNADARLTPLGHSIGLVSDPVFRLFEKRCDLLSTLSNEMSALSPMPETVNNYLLSIGSSPLSTRRPLSTLVVRPDVSLLDIYKRFVPRGTKISFSRHAKTKSSPSLFFKTQEIPETFKIDFPSNDEYNLLPEVLRRLEIQIKYGGYIERESNNAKKLKRLESLTIPPDFDFSKIQSLSIESRIKLARHRPKTIGEASRIPGVSPSDISVLLVYFGR